MLIGDPSRKNLLAVARAYGKAKKLRSATVSRQFHGNQAFLDDFANGECSVTVAKYDEMMLKFSEAWPTRRRWPDGVPFPVGRPEKKIRVETRPSA